MLMKSILILELWGIGDATMMSSVLQTLLAEDWEVTLLGKPHTRALLEPVYPGVKFVEFDAPWTAFYGKYRLWQWPWARIFQVLSQLRREKFEAAISIRSDPRDHLLMWLTGVRRRIGFAHAWSRWLLNEPIPDRDPNAHRVEDWWRLQDRVTGAAAPHLPPHLTADPAIVEKFHAQLGDAALPVIALHCGARIAVRRWPEGYYRQLIIELRKKFKFRLVLIPDPDGYGNSLQDLADHTFPKLSLPELLALLNCAAHLICNDSGPSHLAAALGVPVTVLFGPTKPELFRPFGKDHLVVIRDICEFRPCADYCKFPENYCLTKLLPDSVYAEIENQLSARNSIPLS
jgi:ADP-heptose:LPS heptosyltransferase